MADPNQAKDCPQCSTPDVQTTPGVGGELYGECPNCEGSFTDYDRSYLVVDSDDNSEEGNAARESNTKKGFWW